MIKGEYGNVIAVNTGFDLTGAANMKLKFRAECTSFEIAEADGLAVGTTDLVVDDETTYLANEYVLYTFKPGEISAAGTWRTCIEFEKDGKKRIGETGYFTVNKSCDCSA